jgi:hypothetical protein
MGNQDARDCAEIVAKELLANTRLDPDCDLHILARQFLLVLDRARLLEGGQCEADRDIKRSAEIAIRQIDSALSNARAALSKARGQL